MQRQQPHALSLDALYPHAPLWRGRQPQRQAETLATGFQALDQALHQGGLPAAGLVEILCQTPCPHALRLVLPVLGRLQDGLLALVNPPARPQLDTLKQAGIHSADLLVLRSDCPTTLLRACRETAASSVTSAIVAWLPQGTDTPANLRKLHLAAQQGRCLLIIMRDARQALHASPAPLRLLLRSDARGEVQLNIVKQPGGWGGQQVSVRLLPERVAAPLPAAVQLPAPAANSRPGSRFRDPDSRFGYRPATPVMPTRPASPTHNLQLPL